LICTAPHCTHLDRDGDTFYNGSHSSTVKHLYFVSIQFSRFEYIREIKCPHFLELPITISPLGMLNLFFFSNSNYSCKIQILFRPWKWAWSFSMSWKWRPMVWAAQVVLEYFIALAMQRKQQQKRSIIYCMHCISLLRDNSGQISRASNIWY